MKRLIRCAALALFLTPATGSAQDYDAGMTAYDAGDYSSAFSEFSELADQGDPRAQYQIGVMYVEGEGVATDLHMAAYFFKLAAAQDFGSAQTMLGFMYKIGIDGKKGFISAYMWFDMGGKHSARREVAAKMAPADISEAQRRVRVCVASNYQDCD